MGAAVHFSGPDVYFGVNESTWSGKALAKPGSNKNTIPLKMVYASFNFKCGKPGFVVAVSDKEWAGFVAAFMPVFKDKPWYVLAVRSCVCVACVCGLFCRRLHSL
jgi:hypothetical protein